MEFWFPVEEATEGAARLLVPTIEKGEGEPLDHARSRAAVFYNPLMRLNRDTAVLAVSVLEDASGDPLKRASRCAAAAFEGYASLRRPGWVRSLWGTSTRVVSRYRRRTLDAMASRIR